MGPKRVSYESLAYRDATETINKIVELEPHEFLVHYVRQNIIRRYNAMMYDAKSK